MDIGQDRKKRDAYAGYQAGTPRHDIPTSIPTNSPASVFGLPPSGPEPSSSCQCHAKNKCHAGPPGPKGTLLFLRILMC